MRALKERGVGTRSFIFLTLTPVKFRVFIREFLRNHSMNWTQIFRENLNCYALSIFRVLILLASSDSEKHMLMRQKV